MPKVYYLLCLQCHHSNVKGKCAHSAQPEKHSGNLWFSQSTCIIALFQVTGNCNIPGYRLAGGPFPVYRTAGFPVLQLLFLAFPVYSFRKCSNTVYEIKYNPPHQILTKEFWPFFAIVSIFAKTIDKVLSLFNKHFN